MRGGISAAEKVMGGGVKISQRIFFIGKEKVIVSCLVCQYTHNQEKV